MQTRHRRMIELGLGALAIVALALVEVAGVSGGLLVAVVIAELVVWAAVATVLVRSGRLGRLRKGARA